MRLSATALLLVAALALAGCGGGGDSSVPAPAGSSPTDTAQIEALAERFARAVKAKDARALCELLAPNDVQRLGGGQSDGKKRCLAIWAAKRNPLFAARQPDLRLVEITKLRSSAATALLATSGHLAFLREGGIWYVHLAPTRS